MLIQSDSLETFVTEASSSLTQGSVARHLLRLSFPVLIGHALLLGYGLADSYFISLIDPSSTSLMSGVGTVFPIYFFFLAIALGFGSGTSSLVARSIGAGDLGELSRVGDSGLVLALLMASFTGTVFLCWGDQVVGVIAGAMLGDEARNVACQFLKGMVPGLALMPVSHVLGGILQGEGRMFEAVKSMMMTLVLNIILDPLMIFTFGLGVFGAGLATSLSILIGALYLLWMLIRSKGMARLHFSRGAVRLATMAEIARVGVPNGASMIFLSVFFLFINYAVGSLGEDVMTAWALVGRADDSILLIGHALSAAALTLAGQNSAAGEWSRVRSVWRYSLVFGSIGSLLLASLYMVFAPGLFGSLSDNPTVIALCVSQVRWVAWSYAGIVVSIIFNAFFLGLGRPWPGLASTVIRMGAITTPLIFWLVFVVKAEMRHVLIAVAAMNVLTLPLMWWWAEMLLRKNANAAWPMPPEAALERS